jgi:hypothetical protein
VAFRGPAAPTLQKSRRVAAAGTFSPAAVGRGRPEQHPTGASHVRAVVALMAGSAYLMLRCDIKEFEMPLSPPRTREAIHTRAIEINGYRRADGLYDIEAHLTDTKPFPQTNYDRGTIAAGEPVHDMWLRLTVDDAMGIVGVEAVSDKTPYAICPAAAPNFSRLIGLRIKPGFLREANHLVGGTMGCTHLRELLQQMATTAFQTINPAKVRQEMRQEGTQPTHGSDSVDARITEKMGGPPKILNTCLAYADTGPLVKRRWPALYRSLQAAE